MVGGCIVDVREYWRREKRWLGQVSAVDGVKRGW